MEVNKSVSYFAKNFVFIVVYVIFAYKSPLEKWCKLEKVPLKKGVISVKVL